MPREQIDADEEVERPPEEIHDGGGRASAARTGKRCRKGLATQSASEMRDAVAQESAGKEGREIVHAMNSKTDQARHNRTIMHIAADLSAANRRSVPASAL